MSSVKHWVIVPAAGSGSRMQSDTPKQYMPLLGLPVLSHTLVRLYDGIQPAAIVVVLAEGDHQFAKIAKPPCSIITALGGAQRCDSVLNGLQAIAGMANNDDWVWVHDAARPCVQVGDLQALADVLQTSSAGALLAVKSSDTVKQSGAKQRVSKTLDRDSIWRALTPQVFSYKQLTQALTNATQQGLQVTDESQAMELLGVEPDLVEGSADNIKITKSGDLQLAEFFMQQQTTQHIN